MGCFELGWNMNPLLEGQVRLELTTFCLRGRHSNQLSYWPASKLSPLFRFDLRSKHQPEAMFLLSKLQTDRSLGLLFCKLQGATLQCDCVNHKKDCTLLPLLMQCASIMLEARPLAENDKTHFPLLFGIF